MSSGCKACDVLVPRDAPILPSRGDLPRKWIADEYFDLIVWYRDEAIAGFQLCYGKPYEGQALTWFPGDRYAHDRIDSGDDEPTANRSPVLIAGGVFQKERVLAEFKLRSELLVPEIKNLVLEKLQQYHPPDA